MIYFVLGLIVFAVVAWKARDAFADPAMRPFDGGDASGDPILMGGWADSTDASPATDGCDSTSADGGAGCDAGDSGSD